jgi:hypothetical protein
VAVFAGPIAASLAIAMALSHFLPKASGPFTAVLWIAVVALASLLTLVIFERAARLACGFCRYGHDEAGGQIARGLFEAAERFQYRRLPEVFTGLARDDGSFPVQYVGANVPQAWASGASIHLISGMLGLIPDAPRKRLVLRPALPDWLDAIDVLNLRVGDAWIDLRVAHDGVRIVAQRGDLLDVHVA